MEEQDIDPDDKEEIEIKQEVKIKKKKIFHIQETEQENKITNNILTEYEYSKCIGLRASQIEKGGKIFTNYDNLSNPIDIAVKEFKEKKTPLVLVRHIRNEDDKKIVEKWDLSKMSYFE